MRETGGDHERQGEDRAGRTEATDKPVLKSSARPSEDAKMTSRRSPSRWLAYGLVPTMGALAIGLGSPDRAVSPALTPVHAAVMPESHPVAFVAAAQVVPVADGPTPAASPDTTAPEPPPSPCADALAWVATAGLPLPDGVGYLCPSTLFPHHGAACWGNSTFCPDRPFVAINMDRLAGTSTEYLRHVVAHEVCHILDFQATGRTTEWGADACAAAHGAPA